MQYVLQDISIGENLLRLRKQNKMTQEQVVAKIQLLGSGMSRATYSKIETGTRNIKASDIVALAQVFDVSTDELFRKSN